METKYDYDGAHIDLIRKWFFLSKKKVMYSFKRSKLQNVHIDLLYRQYFGHRYKK